MAWRLHPRNPKDVTKRVAADISGDKCRYLLQKNLPGDSRSLSKDWDVVTSVTSQAVGKTVSPLLDQGTAQAEKKYVQYPS